MTKAEAIANQRKVNNAVVISIRPKWCDLIADGKKTVEVRKTRPRLETPFKCYIYCTYGYYRTPKERERSGDFWTGKPINKVSPGRYWGNGKVIGEFVCDEIEAKPFGNCIAAYYSNKVGTCISDAELCLYADKGRPLYFWHISDLKIYDEPKEISSFYRYVPQRMLDI